MILIDASNITVGGGKVLLEYLLSMMLKSDLSAAVLKRTGIVFKVKDSSGRLQFFDCKGPSLRSANLAELIQRIRPSALFCFGNYPPPFRVPIKTITYFHNPNLLNEYNTGVWKSLALRLKKHYLKSHLRNTDFIVFQAEWVQDAFTAKYGLGHQQEFCVIPFYNDDRIISYQNNEIKLDRFLYVSYPYPHKNHLRLLQAWNVLGRKREGIPLVLTIPREKSFSALLVEIEKINRGGTSIINLGQIDYDEALHQTALSKYVIFPSLKETFGLGLVEGAMLDCIVLGADLPYTYECIYPSDIFDPRQTESMVAKLERATSDTSLSPARVKTRNGIQKLINLLHTN